MAYRLGYNGPEVDKLLQKAYTYSVVNNGWSKLESSDTDPADLNTLVTPGNYSVSFWKNGPVQMNTSGPINICITKDSATGKVYQTIHDAGKIYIRETTSSSFSNTWKEEQNDTELDISSAEPINPVDNYIWIDPSDDVPVIKIYKESTGTWENISPSDMAKQSIYDNKGVKQNINTYLTNKIAEADLETAENAYESHIVEGEAEGNPIHVTDKEKLKWSNGISTEDAQPYITALETEMTSYADEKINTKATSVNSIESTINEDKTKINAHINDNTVHLTAKQVEEFNNKAAGDHKHLNNGSVTVSASNIVGQIPIARLDPSVLERNYSVTTYNEMLSLTKTEVQNGDSVYIKGKNANWTEGTMPGSYSWKSVCYGNDKFVVIAYNSNVFAYSTDGITWTEGTMPNSNAWYSVCYGNDKFVVIAYNSNVFAYSTDGITWTEGTMPNSNEWASVCYGNGKFVVVANRSSTFAYSTDGITWTEGTMPIKKSWCSVCYGNNIFVAITNSDTFAYSTDGITWTEGTMPIDSRWTSVCYGNGKFVTLFDTNALVSTDGITWTETALPTEFYSMSVCYGDGKFVAVADNSSVFVYSTDGITWTEGTMPIDSKWASVCYGNDKFIAIAANTDSLAYSDLDSSPSSAWFVIDDTKLGTTDAFIQYASPNPELTWDNIINKPTSISEYGVTDVYSKEEIDALYNEIMTSLNKSKEIADAFSANVTTTIPSDLSDTYKNNLLLASELNTKLDETLHSLGYDDTMINDMINMYKNRNLKLKTTQEPMIKKSIVIDYINDDNSPYSLTKEELPNCEVFALDSSDNISAMHTVDETYYPGYKKELPDGTGCYVFDGWKRKDLDIPEGETSKEVKVYYVYMNPSTDTLPAEVVSNKPNTADYNLNYLENPSDIHTIDDTHYPEGYSVTTEDGSGTWTFSGWTRLPKSTVDKTVTYEYTINGDKSILPTEVITNKPTDSNYSISLVNPTTEVHTVDDIHYPEGYEIDSTDKSGVWTFSGWGGGNCNIIPINFSALTLGSTFNFGKYQVESETPWSIEWEIVHQTDEYQIAQTKQIIDLRCFDAIESTNTDSNRKSYGNNNWQYSNIKQFLNSDQETWYSSQHQYDAPPNSTNVYNNYNPYDTHKGFLYYFSDEEKNLLKDMTLTLANPSVDGGGSYTWTGKVWLPTYTQLGYGNNNNISEGIKFDKYNSNSDRIKSINKYCAENNTYCINNNYSEGRNWWYWMSSADPSRSFCAWRVYGYGDYIADSAYSGIRGLAPCICLPRK